MTDGTGISAATHIAYTENNECNTNNQSSVPLPPCAYVDGIMDDYYGIDTPKKEELMAANNSIKEMEKKLNLDSLHFLSIKGLYKSMGFEAVGRRKRYYPAAAGREDAIIMSRTLPLP